MEKNNYIENASEFVLHFHYNISTEWKPVKYDWHELYKLYFPLTLNTRPLVNRFDFVG